MIKYYLLSFSSLLLGFFSPFLISDLFEEKLQLFSNSAKSVSNELIRFDIFIDVCLNNIQVIVINIIGFLTFGLLSILSNFYNGLILGLFYLASINSIGRDAFLFNIIPHSIEFIAFIISSALGIELGHLFFKYIIKDSITINMKSIFLKLLISLLIIIISAYIEAYITIQ